MTIKQAIQKAIYAGYDAQWSWFSDGKSNPHFESNCEHCFLDPLFWEFLGKAIKLERYYSNEEESPPYLYFADGKIFGWKAMWMHFINHLASKKTSEEFFNGLGKFCEIENCGTQITGTSDFCQFHSDNLPF